MADTEAAEGPGVGHEQRSRIGGRWERRSHPLTGCRSTQRNPRFCQPNLLAHDGHDTRALQEWLGHSNIQSGIRA